MFDSTIPRIAQTERLMLPMTEKSGRFYAGLAGVLKQNGACGEHFICFSYDYIINQCHLNNKKKRFLRICVQF